MALSGPVAGISSDQSLKEIIEGCPEIAAQSAEDGADLDGSTARGDEPVEVVRLWANRPIGLASTPLRGLWKHTEAYLLPSCQYLSFTVHIQAVVATV